jgi:hypothetical protein
MGKVHYVNYYLEVKCNKVSILKLSFDILADLFLYIPGNCIYTIIVR